ncbi:MAG: hypothetical protein H7333_04975 [Bdellovibrionales bacterium]|nr:hypothetical protein [Oligoflexia bacterium]
MRTPRNLTLIAAIVLLGSCAKQPVTPGLVSTSEMGTLRGQHYVRVATHFHSPYSFDACDGKGFHEDGTIDLTCLHDAKYAFCENHVNFVFFTDHVEHIVQTDYAKLLLREEGDTPVINGSGTTVGTQIHCPDGFTPVLAPGLEGQLLALGLEAHVAPDEATRRAVYGGDTVTEKTALEGAGALVAIPHTESRDTQALIALQPDVIEIYNVHANLDPKIRKKWLGKKPFDKIAKFLNYIADPYNSLHADFIFTDFLEYSDIYFEKWNALLAANLHVTGVGGLDSHQNIFSQKASDGQRLDSHRRMTRFFSNLVMTTGDDLSTIKAAIKAGKVYFAVEGLGTPVGQDFHGLIAGTPVEMGSTLTAVAPQTSSLQFHVPAVHSQFPGMDSKNRPEIWAELHYIDSSAKETVVARVVGAGTDLTYLEPPAGHYRIHVWMKPHHLKDFLFEEKHGDEAFQWMISNVIRVVR